MILISEAERQLAGPEPDTRISVRAGSLWRGAIMLLSSAALGGLALAIWNRKSLGSMRTDESRRASRRYDQE